MGDHFEDNNAINPVPVHQGIQAAGNAEANIKRDNKANPMLTKNNINF